MIIICDTREQLPYHFSDFDCNVIRAGLPIGDYSLQGFTDQVAVERKTLNDLLGSLTRGRDRFEKELSRARHYQLFAVVIEGTFNDIRQGRYRSKIHPNAVLQSIIAWTIRYNVQFIWAGDRDGGEYFTYSVLSKYLYEIDRRYKIARASA